MVGVQRDGRRSRRNVVEAAGVDAELYGVGV